MAKLPADPTKLRQLSSAYGAVRARLLRSLNDGLSAEQRVELLTATFDLAEIKVAQNDEHLAAALYDSAIELGLAFVSPRFPLLDHQLRRLPVKFNSENPMAQLIGKLAAVDKIRLFESLAAKSKSVVAKALTNRDRLLLNLKED